MHWNAGRCRAGRVITARAMGREPAIEWKLRWAGGWVGWPTSLPRALVATTWTKRQKLCQIWQQFVQVIDRRNPYLLIYIAINCKNAANNWTKDEVRLTCMLLCSVPHLMKALSSPSEQLLFNGTGLMWAPTHNLQQPYLKVHPLGNRCTIASIDGTGFMQNIMKTH